ncbi:MAG TPA: VOC family protein [Actinomycetota bacterium]|nr:VOC family protein [Actinomycetota bacterium]
MLRLDHVVLAVRDLEASAGRLWEEQGIRFEPGGRHAAWGTANMIAPLGGSYLELLGVVDPDVGRVSALGRTLTELSADGDRWFSVCLSDEDIERTAARLGLTVRHGSRTRPDGVEVRWRGAGIDERGDELWLPFFIDWDVPARLHPGAGPGRHRVDVRGIDRVEVAGDETRLREWVEGRDVPIRVVAGDPGVRRVVLALGDGELVIEG